MKSPFSDSPCNVASGRYLFGQRLDHDRHVPSELRVEDLTDNAAGETL